MTGKTLLSVDDLARAGLLAPSDVLRAVTARYSVAVTPQIAALIDPAEADDPIARQFLPDARELVTQQVELADPIGDDAHSPVPGLVHRYPDRVLLKLLSVCPVYCRFCFRRETVGQGKKGVNFGRRSPGSGGQNCMPNDRRPVQGFIPPAGIAPKFGQAPQTSVPPPSTIAAGLSPAPTHHHVFVPMWLVWAVLAMIVIGALCLGAAAIGALFH